MAEQEQSVEEIKAERDKYLAGWQRAQADYENLKRETAARNGQLSEMILEGMLMEMLPTLDSLQLALAHAPNPPEADTPMAWKDWVDGIRHIERHFADSFRQFGVDAVDALGKPFDPACMEAVGEIAGEADGGVVEVKQAGYRIGEKCLRPAKVIVSKIK
ncbi:MAG: nucleotide exchange factor GrpE [Candidatus Magasanikbacteria bacterium]|nr:nucleotide exchange factor GrpE [Candidatus Magasanikbacteria bacterium]